MTWDRSWTTSVFLSEANEMEALASRKSPAKQCRGWVLLCNDKDASP